MELWLLESTLQGLRQDWLRKSKGEDGVIFSKALESVLMEYGIGTADLELAIDDRGWMSLSTQDSSGLTEFDRTKVVRRARAYFVRDPLSKQAVRIWTDFALGRGISWKAKDDNTGEVLRDFWDAKANESVLSNQGQRKSSDKLLVDGEVFFVFFSAGRNVKIRLIDPLEITEIITDPDDRETKKLYKRFWTDTQNQTHEKYYLDWANEDKEGSWPDMTGGMQSATASGIIYHVPFNSLGIRGNSLLLSAMDWAKAHRKFLEARASITQALARFAWKAKLKGTSAQVSAARTAWQSSIASGSDTETNPPTAPGGTFVENEGYNLTPIKTESGANAAQVDANMLLQIFGSAVGVFPHYFGAGEAFRLATACYSEDTEILTEVGWKRHGDWQEGEKVACYDSETGELVYGTPSEMLTYDYSEPMISIKGRGFDSLVTPNHRMLILNENNVSRKWAKTEYEVLPADNLPARFALPTCVVFKGGLPQAETFILQGYTGENGIVYDDKAIPINDWLEFLGWWISEGWLEENGLNKTIGIKVSSKSPEVAKLRGLMGRLPFGFSEGENGGGTRWRCISKPLFNWLDANCGKGAANKRVPQFVYGLPSKKQRMLLDALWLGDGHSEMLEHYRGFYTTISKGLADDVQRLILHCGEWGSVAVSYMDGEKLSAHVKTNHTCYVVHRNVILKRSLGRRSNISRVDYSGRVMCFVVPTGFYITRRNGNMLIAGNTAMERPMRVQFEAYQQLWADVYDNIFNFVMEKNSIPGNKRFVDIDFPPLVDKDANEKIKAIIEVVAAMPELDGDEMRKLVLTTLGLNNPDEILKSMDPVEAASVKLVKALKEVNVALRNGNGKKEAALWG